MYWRILPVLVFVCAGLVPAQRLWVTSEFQRIMPSGEVYPPDRIDKPREFISPAVARNYYASFRVAVEVPKGAVYSLFVGQNPEKTVAVRLYQERYEKVGAYWVPDALQEVRLPLSASLAEGQKVQTYWLDVGVPPEAPPGRFRLEVQMNVDDTWYVAPMELRINRLALPGPVRAVGALPPVAARSDTAAWLPLRLYACGNNPAPETDSSAPTIRQMIRRNALQDVALSRQREPEETKSAVAGQLVRATGLPDVPAFCAASPPPPLGAEWWLRVRDYAVQGKPVP
jgi:hypothetical protein